MAETLHWENTTLLGEVERRSGAPVGACFQCHKCSTGCPIAPDMDLLSSQVMRLVHLGEEEAVLRSRAIWLCASCEACSTRCPMDIDVAAVMDALRMMATEKDMVHPDVRGEKFNRSFLGSVCRHGRVFEFGMLAAYKLRCGDLMSDVDKFPQMVAKGKIGFLPNRGGDSKQVRQIFRRADEEEKKR